MKMTRVCWDSLCPTPQHTQTYLSLYERKCTLTDGLTPGNFLGLTHLRVMWSPMSETTVCRFFLIEPFHAGDPGGLAFQSELPAALAPQAASPGCRVKKHWPVGMVSCLLLLWSCKTVDRLCTPCIHLIKKKNIALSNYCPGASTTLPPPHISALPSLKLLDCSFS